MHHSVCTLSVQSERVEEGVQGRLHTLRQLYIALLMSILNTIFLFLEPQTSLGFNFSRHSVKLKLV